MKNPTVRRLKPTSAGWIIAATVAVLLTSSAAIAERPIIHVRSEIAVEGVTPAEFLTRQAELLTALTALIPMGTLDSPVQVPITQSDRDSLNVRTPNGDAPLRIGVVKVVTGVEILGGQGLKRGNFVRTADGGFVWAMSIESPDAQAIRVRFDRFSLPSNVEMYFFGEGTVVDGPYTGTGRNNSSEFWTRSIASD